MASGLWDKVKGALGVGADRGEGPPALVIAKYFKALGKLDRNLPQQIALYVVEGDNSSILSTLSGQAARDAWAGQPRFYPRRDQEALFVRAGAWRADQAKRLGEALEALDPLTYDWAYYGTRASPAWLRHVATLWLADDSRGERRTDRAVEWLRALGDEAGLGVAPTLDILLSGDAQTYGTSNTVGRFTGVAEFFAAEHEAIKRDAASLRADARAELSAQIGRYGVHALYLDLLLDNAVGSSKKTRAAARRALAGADRGALGQAIEARFAAAPPSQRAELVETAAHCLAEDAPPVLERLAQGETAPKVLTALSRAAGAIRTAEAEDTAEAQRPDGVGGYAALDGTWVELPPLALEQDVGPLDLETLKLLEPAVAAFNALFRDESAKAQKGQWHWTNQYRQIKPGDLDQIKAIADGRPVKQHGAEVLQWLRYPQFRHEAIDAFLDDPRLSFRQLMRLGVANSNHSFHSLVDEWSGPIGAALQRRLTGDLDMRAMIALWTEAGGGDFIVEHLGQRWYWPLPELDAPLWPALVDRFDVLDEALGLKPQSGDAELRALPALRLLATMPKVPARYRSRLMILASDSSRHIREPARELLRAAPGLGEAIAAQLADGRQDTRAFAADWLARRGERGEAPALRKALTREKSDLARAAMITALERLGEDVSEYFDPAAMVKQAEAGLAKTKVKGLDWFDFDRLPALTWRDGAPVDPVLPRWWVMLTAKLKQPGGNALVDMWLDRLAPGDAHKLGWMALAGWIDEDTRRPTDDEANAYAASHVDATLQQYIDIVKRYPQSAEYYPTDRAVVFARLKAMHGNVYLGSAADSKGVLALSTRVNGVDAAQRARAFLKDHGARVSQSKALLDALAANPASAALQVVLAAANRSKQKSVQAHAAALVEGIADRNGWTAAQLADRTIPTGGLDVDGALDLDCGEGRTYQARLDDADALVLLNPDGREVKALPGPRIDEEKPAVDAAKKLLSSARKEVKQVFAAQTERLQEAMFLQRVWRRDDWENYIAAHPVVGRLAARLIWRGVDEDGNGLGAFRPLGDGSYTDAEDNDVDPGAFAAIGLAHSSALAPAMIAAWRGHLTDYAVVSPFDQIGRDLPELPEDKAREKAIVDREGWMIETFKLRGAAAKLGYQRGAAQDGGWFMTYERAYSDAGLVAEIAFTGSPLPEENRAAALQSLSFRKLRPSGQTSYGAGGQIPLGEVPPVLLAESWRDLHDIADKGTGFDPDWNTKAY